MASLETGHSAELFDMAIAAVTAAVQLFAQVSLDLTVFISCCHRYVAIRKHDSVVCMLTIMSALHLPRVM